MRKFFARFRELSSFKKIVITLSLLVLVASLTQPAFYIDRKDYDAWSNSLLLFLFSGFFFLGGSMESFLWWANPIYFFALFLFIRGNRFSIPLSFIAAVIAFSFSRFTEVLSSESGEMSKIRSFEPGYKLWVASFVILFLGTVISTVMDAAARGAGNS